MKSGRFFVTLVVILGMAELVACTLSRAHDGGAQAAAAHRDSLVQEGNAKIGEALSLESEIKSRFGVDLSSSLTPVVNWRHLSRGDRREVGGKLAHFLQLVNRVLEIDTQKDITIERREKILSARDSAETLQRGLENFEKIYGQNWELKRSSLAPLHAAND